MDKFKSEYCFVITNKCNWFCEYCIVDTHNNTIQPEEVLKSLELIKSGSSVSLSGGEPGMEAYEYLNNIISKLKEKQCSIEVNTNGLFISKYSKFFYDDIHSFFYHCSENLDPDTEIEIYNDPDNKINYMIVVTDNNLKNLDNFLKKYNFIKFNVLAGAITYYSKIGLSKINGIRIWNKYKNIITPESKSFLLNGCLDTTKHIKKI